MSDDSSDDENFYERYFGRDDLDDLDDDSEMNHFRKPLREVTDVDVDVFGLDIQAIDWSQLPWTRTEFRNTRIQGFQNYRNVELDPVQEALFQQSARSPLSRTPAAFYHFQHTRLRDHPAISHFQLRNLVCATSKNDVFFASPTTVRHITPHTQHASRPVIDLTESGRTAFRISTMCAANVVGVGVAIAGGFSGEFALRRWSGGGGIEDQGSVGNGDHCGDLEEDEWSMDAGESGTPPKRRKTVRDATKDRSATPEDSQITTGYFNRDVNGIINSITVDQSRSGAPTAYVSSNDNAARLVDLHALKVVSRLQLPWCVNYTARDPVTGLVCVVGDAQEAWVVDEGGKVVSLLRGHVDFSFACAWNPTGTLLATGNQDRTARIYDTRILPPTTSTESTPTVATLGTRMGAVRSLRFSSDGRVLAVAEPADFVQVWECGGRWRGQEIDFFGEIAGISFAPDASSLFIGNSDNTYGGILEFSRTPLSLNSDHSLFVRGERTLLPLDGDFGVTGTKERTNSAGSWGESPPMGSSAGVDAMAVGRGPSRARPYWYVKGA
ncbi:YVTN repeat-like/Quino protein amine dehydrogenase [Gonapodya prolifera JEL478]|uniref:YVTN repeat-like/Quino protein amine dehydrogenase n=1 Tax=Gonapodya prolifera (strain JEL478) TaxID=1344416 RepID=A0A139AEJ4_GONPJ|nr:YVTN repeat-like/Quino protein amine dehydrogenase [Gonapodya prolifera JEL478]|eukprot:KXS15246.1 YVTN repeat-like/Quino protein amine dehydrogenase [Gonapodya prolifera JEL478]